MAEHVEQSTDNGTGGIPAGSWRDGLPEVHVPIAPADVIARLQKRSQRGELPGFRTQDKVTFEVAAFGVQFDRVISGDLAKADHGARIAFASQRPWKVLALIWVVFALTLWPGGWLTHSMFVTWFGWYRLSMWWTMAWYVPLTLLAIPALLKMQLANEKASWAHAHEMLDKIASTCDGSVERC